MNDSIAWNHPGSRWWKFDLHTHTPASADTYWAKEGAALTPEQWLLRYMQAEVDCVVVTDHNTGAWIDKLKHAYERMSAAPPADFRALHLFPGVELSVNGGFHLLAIFDVGKLTSDIDTLLGAVDYVGTKGDSDGVTRKSAVEVIEAVISSGGLPIPAHVDQKKGMLEVKEGASSVLDPNTLRQVCDSGNLLAMEVVAPDAPKPQVYKNAHCDWTEVIGSDSHNFKGTWTPGSRFTWVKMARPSLDGLRLALLDGARFSVRRSDIPDGSDLFRRPEHFIGSIEISNARYMGRGEPARLEFNPWFNALVGGRGTGKSTVVHALRLSYRREEDLKRLDQESEARRDFEAFKQVPKNRTDTGGLTRDTELLVSLTREGVLHRLRWRQDAIGDAVEELRGGAWARAESQGIAPERFPVRIFSQGQIAALAGERQDALLGLIDEAAQARNAKRALDDARQRFLAARAQIRAIDGRLKGRDEIAVKLEDIKRKLAGFEGKEHTEILKTYQRRSRQERELERQFETAKAVASRIEGLSKDLVSEDLPPGAFENSDSADATALGALGLIRKAIANARGEVRATADALEASRLAARQALEASEWRVAATGAKERYTALTAELRSQGVADPSEYGKLVQERQRLEGEIDRFESLRREREKLADEATGQRGHVRAARRELSKARREFLGETLANNAYVRIALVPYGRDLDAIDRGLRETLGLAVDDKFSSDILTRGDDSPRQGVVADLLRDLPDDGVDAALQVEARLLALGERFERACAGRPEFGGHFNNYLQRECGKQPELLDRLLVFSPEDTLGVEYSLKGDGTGFRPINQASAGQRAAAMLAFLLAHGTEPMVLDQPEDDLDNHLIYDLVVRQIRENKMRRQLIVVTHNPNIVVNGDAEMLHALDFKEGQCRVVQSGSLQEQSMREEVCRVMEGGPEAFKRRYQRLGRKD